MLFISASISGFEKVSSALTCSPVYSFNRKRNHLIAAETSRVPSPESSIKGCACSVSSCSAVMLTKPEIDNGNTITKVLIRKYSDKGKDTKLPSILCSSSRSVVHLVLQNCGLGPRIVGLCDGIVIEEFMNVSI